MDKGQVSKWLQDYDKSYPIFEWFIQKYCSTTIPMLKEAREQGNTPRMINLLNDVWFDLPDSKFNIIQNPKGWKEFLSLIEF
jgi:hypothetical protein